MILHNKEFRMLCRSHSTVRKRSADGFGKVDFYLRQVEKQRTQDFTWCSLLKYIHLRHQD